jgi:hypothetical protein
MLRFQTLILLLSLSIKVNGTDIPDYGSDDPRMAETIVLSKESFFNEDRKKFLSISEDIDLPWDLRLQALDELSTFNEIGAVQGYLRLLTACNLRQSVKLKIEIQLTRIIPDLHTYQRIIRDPNSTPLEHFNAAYYLQDWILPEHAVYPFELLLKKIERQRLKLYPISRDQDEKEYCQKYNECLSVKTNHLEKIYDASTVIISVLESQFTRKLLKLPKLNSR